MMKRLAMLFALTAAACGGSSKPETTPTPTTAEPAAATGTALELGELKLVDTSKNQALLIHADGTIDLGGQKLAKVTAEGTIVKIDTGEVGLKLEADGAVKGPGGEDIGAKIDAEGVLTIGDKKLSLGPDGTLVGGNDGAPGLKVEGATSAGLRRTAMFVVLAMVAGSQEPAPAPGAAPAPAP